MVRTTERFVGIQFFFILLVFPGLSSSMQHWRLDPWFGMGGIVITDFAGVANDLVLQEDGKLVLGGAARLDGEYGFAAVRLLPDGTLDPTFGTGGLAVVDLENGDAAYGMALQGGRVLLGGISSISADHHRMTLIRLTSSGVLDETFGVDGVVLVHPSSFQKAEALIVLADGRIVAAGSIGGIGNTVFIVARFHVDGALDESFGHQGIARMTTEGSAADAVVDSQGRTLVVGKTGIHQGVQLAMVRLDDSGQVDDTFGDAGWVFLPGPDWTFSPRRMALQTDGKIIVVGKSYPGDEGGLLAIRLLPDGALDLEFGSEGFVALGPGSSMIGTDVLVQDDGLILLSGQVRSGDSSDFMVARLTPEGLLDESFGDDGIIQTSLLWDDQALAAAIDGSGGILLAGRAGSSNARIGVARYLGHPPPVLEIPTLEHPLLLLLAFLLGGVGVSWLRRSALR